MGESSTCLQCPKLKFLKSVCLCARLCTRVCVYMYVHVCVSVHACEHCVHVCVFLCIHLHVCTSCMCVHVCVCTVVCVHVYVRILCIYSHTCKCTFTYQEISAVSVGFLLPYFSVSVEFLYTWNEEPPAGFLAPRAYSSIPADLEGSSGEQL